MGECVVCAKTMLDWSQTIFVYITQGSRHEYTFGADEDEDEEIT